MLLRLYNTLILPYFNYCNIIWAACKSIYRDRLFIQQKKAIRIICLAKWNSHTEPLFLKLNLLIVYNFNKFQTYCFMYKYYYNLLQESVQN